MKAVCGARASHGPGGAEVEEQAKSLRPYLLKRLANSIPFSEIQNVKDPRKPKIAHIIHEGSGGGGATLSLNYFPRYLEHYDVFAITGREGDLAQRLRQEGIRTHAMALDRPGRCMLTIPRLAWTLRQERPDVAVVHGQWGGFAGAVAAALAGVRHVIYYTHMPSFYTDWDLFRLIRNRIAESVTCGIADELVCPSTGNRYQYLIRELKSEDHITCIPNGLDTSHLKPAEDRRLLRRELHLPETGPLVVSVGRLSDQKRVDWLLEAWKTVEEQIPNATLAVVGDGPERMALQLLVHRLGLKHVLFLGRQPSATRYFACADAGVITTLFEAQPYALLEAMSVGCPMVGTASDGVRDTIHHGDTGLCVSVGNPDLIATALLRLLHDPALREQIGRQAREYAVKHFDLKAVMPQQFAVVEKCLFRENNLLKIQPARV
jgi:glycosyltransferase involved in cell wall biosynthesis